MDQDKHSHLPFFLSFLPRLLEHHIQRLKVQMRRRDVHMTSTTFEVHTLSSLRLFRKSIHQALTPVFLCFKGSS